VVRGRPRIVSCYEATTIVNLAREGRLSKAAGRTVDFRCASWCTSNISSIAGPGLAGPCVQCSRVLLFWNKSTMSVAQVTFAGVCLETSSRCRSSMSTPSLRAGHCVDSYRKVWRCRYGLLTASYEESGSSWVCFGSFVYSTPSQSRTNVSVAMPGRVAHGFVRWFFFGGFSAGVLLMPRPVDVRSVGPSIFRLFVVCWVFGRRNYTEWRRCPLVIIWPVYKSCAVPTSKLLRWPSCCLCLRSVRVLVLLVGFLSYSCGEGLVVFLLTSPIHSLTPWVIVVSQRAFI